jgi:hypothetical protein
MKHFSTQLREDTDVRFLMEVHEMLEELAKEESK